MKKNPYLNLMEQIEAPTGLNDRVLAAARRRRGTASVRGGARRAPGRNRMLRGAVCAACALALVLGGLTLRPAGPEAEQGGGAAPTWSFGLTAYAADTGEALEMEEGRLAFTMDSGMYLSKSGGYFTGCLFQVTGEDIQTVSLSLDREGLYRSRRLKDLTEEEMREIREEQEAGRMAPTSIDQDENGVWSTQEMTLLGGSVTEPYDPEARYGFWVACEDWDPQADIREYANSRVDALEGAVLTVTVTAADGTRQSQSLTLHTGKLKAAWNEDGTQRPLPELAAEGEPHIYGVYGELSGGEH